MITHQELLRLTHYDPDTGVMKWKVRRSNYIHIGDSLGTEQTRGGLETHIDHKSYQVHRLAWFWVHGLWPKATIDHINGDRLDNRLCNLRDLPQAENCQNQRRARTNNKLGILGVHFDGHRYIASIMKDYRNIKIGRFKTPQEAQAAYLRVKREIHPACVI